MDDLKLIRRLFWICLLMALAGYIAIQFCYFYVREWTETRQEKHASYDWYFHWYYDCENWGVDCMDIA